MGRKSIVRVAFAGSVDDGKSTLIGRLLYETGSLHNDQLAEAKVDEAIENLARLTDGLRAEREQNITIDVAYKPLRTANRRYIIADAPGHVSYTRNMVTASSFADVVVVLVDAAKGLTDQSRRHLTIASLLRPSAIAIAVNKMDAVGYSEPAFKEIESAARALATLHDYDLLTAIPVSALTGDNVVAATKKLPWFKGPSLLEFLDSVPVASPVKPRSGMQIQGVATNDGAGRLYFGQWQGQEGAVGKVVFADSGGEAKISEIWVAGSPVEAACEGDPVALRLDAEMSAERGTWLTLAKPVAASDRFSAVLFWLQPDVLRVGMNYRLAVGAKRTFARVVSIDSEFDVAQGEWGEASTLAENGIAKVTIQLTEPLDLEVYEQDRARGAIVLIDPKGQTVAGGVATALLDSAEDAGGLTVQEGKVIWLTGLSGAGKSTIATAFEERLRRRGDQVVHLDGDELRRGLCNDLGFSPEDRQENVRRMAEVAKLFSSRGMTVVCSLISPRLQQREAARRIIGDDFREVFIRCAVAECERRDPKGLYARARAGEIPGFTGISAPYEEPETPDLVLETEFLTVDQCVDRLDALLRALL